MKFSGSLNLSFISSRALLVNMARKTAAVGAIAAISTVVAIGTAQAQVTPGGSVTSIGPSPAGVIQNVVTPSTVGAFGPGTLSVSGGGTTLNIFDGGIPDAIMRVGVDNGTGRAVVNNGGVLNVTASNPASDDALLIISGTAFDAAPSQAGTLILGDDPATGPVESTGFVAVRATDDALVSIGRTGDGTLLMTNSSMGITAIGAGPGSAALLELGSSTVGNAVGRFTASNSNIEVDAQGGGAAVVSVGRRTNTVTNPVAALAPENTMLLDTGTTLRILTNTGTSFFNVGRDGARGTATIDGVATRVEVDDFVQVGRDGGFGTLNVSNGAEVDNFAFGGASETRIGTNGGTGTLNIETGGIYNTKTLAIAQGADSDGTVNIDGNGSLLRQNFDGPATTLVGQTGTGRLNVRTGGDLVVDDPAKTGQFLVGAEAGSDGAVTVDGAGSTITAARETQIGQFGDGSLVITNGGTFQTSRLFGALEVGSTGKIDVDGPGSELNLRGTDEFGNGPIALIGLDGVSTMSVTNGGTVNIDPNGEAVTGLSGGLLIGGAGSATGAGDGAVNVDGAGSAINIGNVNASIQVGRNGLGDLNITDGGKITNAPGDALTIVGRTGVSTGAVTVNGTGSEFQAGSDLFVGTEVDITTRTILAGGGTGSIDVESGGTMSARRMFIENGDVDVTTGGTVTGRLAILGSEAGATAEMNVSGAGSRVDLTGKSPAGNRAALVVGDEGTATPMAARWRSMVPSSQAGGV